MKPSKLALTLALPSLLAPSLASAGTITAEGAVTALDDVTQITSVAGSALFDAATTGDVPLDVAVDQGLTFHIGPLIDILPGVAAAGEAVNPIYVRVGDRFPFPIAGGGVANLGTVFYAGALTFSDPITQFGMTAGGGMIQYLTAYDDTGMIIGQVKWEPDPDLEDAAFVGIDTNGVPIAMLLIGNDDIAAGEEYVVTGAGTASDTWLWGAAAPCATDADCLDDTWACTMQACTDGACVYSPTAEACDDADACTETDTCTELECVGSPVNCSDGDICTFDSCDAIDGCSSEPIEECCLSDEDCPEGETCLLASNTCKGGPPPPPEDPETSGEEEEGGEDTESGGETGPAVDDSSEGCSCAAPEQGGAAGLLGFGLLVLVSLGRRRRED